jgi:N-carbamoyl-L-amino-acid hydrolase
MDTDIDIDRHRLRVDVETTGEFGSIGVEDGRGRTNLAGTEANRAAREYLVDRMEAAGLDVTVDAVGNVRGRWVPEGVDPDTPPVATGSHLDSVPEGGIFDGPLGVFAGLEAVRALQEAGASLERPVDVVSFTEEEGVRFADGLLGSSVAVGKRSPEEALELADDDGTTLEAALSSIGFQGEGRLDATEWDAWLELHVEQDTSLDEEDVPVGLVTDVAGITHCEVTITGEADHAGTTAMDDRADALAAASEFVLDVERAVRDAVVGGAGTAVGTVGHLSASPDATNVVPGRVEMGVDVRDVDRDIVEGVLDRAETSLDRLERDRDVDTDIERGIDLYPTPTSERVGSAVLEAADATTTPVMELHSGAAHDTMHVADVTDAGLLFAPSRDGVSHSPQEWTDWDDCATASSVLAGSIARLARRE